MFSVHCSIVQSCPLATIYISIFLIDGFELLMYVTQSWRLSRLDEFVLNHLRPLDIAHTRLFRFIPHVRWDKNYDITFFLVTLHVMGVCKSLISTENFLLLTTEFHQ